jgi:hypothetical protein
MSKRIIQNSILEGLRKLSMPINEALSLKKDDKVKVIKNTEVGMYARDVWMMLGEPRTLSASNPNRKYYNLIKLKKDGSPTSWMNPANMINVYTDTIDKYLADGYLKILGEDEPFSAGEVDIKRIRELMQDNGIDKLAGLSIGKLVTGSGSDIRIDLGTEKKEILATKIGIILTRSNITINQNVYNPDGRFIYIKKMQG